MQLFPISFGNEYIFLVVNYVSNCIVEIPTRTNEARAVVKFKRENIFSRCSKPCAIISDYGAHFNN